MSTATTITDFVHGEVKVGRWTYPAYRTHRDDRSPMIFRHPKREGGHLSEYVLVTGKLADSFAPDNPEPTVSNDYVALRDAYYETFDAFAVDVEDLAAALAVPVSRARVLLHRLVELTLVSHDVVNGDRVWQAVPTYDSIDRAEAEALFELTVPADVSANPEPVRPVKNNTKAAPGRSKWVVGAKCPKGHKLTDKTLYKMPSGRFQCRVCRGGYPSRSSE